MNVSNISVLSIKNSIPLQYKQFSKYAQKYFRSDVNSFIYNFNNFFSVYKPSVVTKKMLDSIGIKQVGQNTNEGIIIRGREHDYHVKIPNNALLQLNYIKPDSDSVLKSITISNNIEQYAQTGFATEDIEDVLSELIANIDSKIISAKKKLTANVPKPFIPNQTTSERIQELNKTLRCVKNSAAIKNFGHIDDEEMALYKSIVSEYYNIKELYKKVPNDASRFNVRSYYRNYVTSKSGQKTMTFKDIGPLGETISLFYTRHKNKSYVALKVTDYMDKECCYVISENGTVQKNMPYRDAVYANVTKRKNSIPDYYTQDEISSSKLYTYLSCINRELKLFAQHTENWLNSQEQYKIAHTNNEIGTTTQYNEIIKDLYSNFQEFKKNVIKYIPDKKQRDSFKIKNNISPQLATTSLTFLNILPNGNDLKLSFPTIPQKTATQILELHDDKVEKTFYILDNKLLKLEFKKKTDRFVHYNRNMYYYDNEYINKSKLSEYLELLRNKLETVNNELKHLKNS